LNHSLKRVGASFSMFVAKFSKPSKSESLRTRPQFLFGNQSSSGFSAPMKAGALSRKLK